MEEEPKGWMWTSQPLPGSSPLPVSSSFIFEEGREEVRSDRWESGSEVETFLSDSPTHHFL